MEIKKFCDPYRILSSCCFEFWAVAIVFMYPLENVCTRLISILSMPNTFPVLSISSILINKLSSRAFTTLAHQFQAYAIDTSFIYNGYWQILTSMDLELTNYGNSIT